MGGASRLPSGNERYEYRHRLLVARSKLDGDGSPKSVIADARFVSPASSSSSSLDHRPRSVHHDSGYSISDGECSDPDPLLDPSRELNKICGTSRSLETLPETHSLTLNATKTREEARADEVRALALLVEDEPQVQHHGKRSPRRITSHGNTSHQDLMSVAPTGSGSDQSGVLCETSAVHSPEKGMESLSPVADHRSRGVVPFHHRFIGPRPTPSKWDDAEKWIVSPGHHEPTAQPQRPQPLVQTGRRHSLSHRPNFEGGSPDFATRAAKTKPLSPPSVHMNGGQAEIPNRHSKALSFSNLSKRVFDTSHTTSSTLLPRFDEHATAMETPFYHTGAQTSSQSLEARQASHGHAQSTHESSDIRTPTGRCLELSNLDMEILKHALTEPTSGHCWGFERPRNSPCRTPTFSPSPARHNTPAARPPSRGSYTRPGLLELQTWHLAKLELSKHSSGVQAMAWSTREEEDLECSVSLRELDEKTESDQTRRQERREREEARIRAWEELHTSRAEAELQRTQLKLEKLRERAVRKMTTKVALVRNKAREMRAEAWAEVEATPVQTPNAPFRCCFTA